LTFFFQAEDGIRDGHVTGVQTCGLPISCGTPTIVAGLGALEEMVADERTGIHFVPGNAEDLACKVEWVWTHPRDMEEIGQAGRAEFVAKYTADRNYEMLMAIYKRAIESRQEDLPWREN